MKRYERITIRPEGSKRSRTGWYVVESEGPLLLLLTPVDSAGNDRSYQRPDGVFVEVQELVSIDLIRKRQPATMNPHYGFLEVAK